MREREDIPPVCSVAVYQVHGDDDHFELLINYVDGREVGTIVDRDVIASLILDLEVIPGFFEERT